MNNITTTEKRIQKRTDNIFKHCTKSYFSTNSKGEKTLSIALFNGLFLNLDDKSSCNTIHLRLDKRPWKQMRYLKTKIHQLSK